MSDTVPPLARREDFAGRVALVTGGSDGLGKHLVQTLVSLGCHVFFCGRRRELGEELARELNVGQAARLFSPKEQASGLSKEARDRRDACPTGLAHFVQADLADPSAAEAFVREAGRFSGKIDYLVNNAAIDPRIEFEKATVADFDRLIAINFRPMFTVTHAALPLLKTGTGKSIVNLCTTNYMLGLSPFTLYNASKSAIVGFTRSLARELGPLGIRANVISPGWIMTAKQLREHVTEKDQQDLLEAQAMKFLLSEQHVTPATLFLLSPAAAGITGQNLVVDGGKVMQ